MRIFRFKNYLTLILFVLFVFVSTHSPVLAQATNCTGDSCPPTLLQMLKYFQPFIGTLQSLAVIVFFIVISYSGFSFITAGGDSEKIKSAKNTLIFSVIGFALIFIPFFILPVIINATGLQNSISTQNGSLKFNASSSFTPTPLPSYLINTSTFVPTFPPPPPPGQLPNPSGSQNSNTCGTKVTYCLPVFFSEFPTNIEAGTSFGKSGNCTNSSQYGNYGEYNCSSSTYNSYSSSDESLHASIADVMDAYLQNDGYYPSVTVLDAINNDTSPAYSYFGGEQSIESETGATAQSIADKLGGNGRPAALQKWRAFSSSSQDELTNFAHAGIPVITELDSGQFVVVKDYSGGILTFIDPSRAINTSFNKDGTKSMDINTFNTYASSHTFIMLQPIDWNDYIYKDFSKRDQYSVIMAECISYHESRFNPLAINSNTNGSVDEGVMQINSVHWGDKTPEGPITQQNLFNPEFNIQAGYTLYTQQSFRIWSTYHFCW